LQYQGWNESDVILIFSICYAVMACFFTSVFMIICGCVCTRKLFQFQEVEDRFEFGVEERNYYCNNYRYNAAPIEFNYNNYLP